MFTSFGPKSYWIKVTYCPFFSFSPLILEKDYGGKIQHTEKSENLHFSSFWLFLVLSVENSIFPAFLTVFFSSKKMVKFSCELSEIFILKPRVFEFLRILFFGKNSGTVIYFYENNIIFRCINSRLTALTVNKKLFFLIFYLHCLYFFFLFSPQISSKQ
jgi:hypothetical protein